MVESEYLRVKGLILPSLIDAEEPDLLLNLRSGHAQLWPGENAAFVTQCVTDPPRLHVWLAGGDLRELLSMIPGMAAWGRAQGCEWATVDGRPGWKRILKPYGFVEHEGELWKEL